MTIDREDILIGRAVDGELSDQDWAELGRLAQSDAEVWRRLGLAQREHAALSSGFEEAIAVSDAVELPQHAIRAAQTFHIRLRAWSGWAAAATIGLIWATTQGLLPTATSPAGDTESGQTAGLVDPASWTPRQAFDQYISRGKREGQVLSELPNVMVQSQPTADGSGYEVIILRRIMERTIVSNLYSIGQDDAGQPRVVPMRRARNVSNRPM